MKCGFFVIKSVSNDKALCLIRNDTIAVLKEYNIRRQYETKHFLEYSKFTGQLCKKKFEKMKKTLLSMHSVFKKKIAENEAATRARGGLHVS